MEAWEERVGSYTLVLFSYHDVEELRESKSNRLLFGIVVLLLFPFILYSTHGCHVQALLFTIEMKMKWEHNGFVVVEKIREMTAAIFGDADDPILHTMENPTLHTMAKPIQHNMENLIHFAQQSKSYTL